jgi:3-dehydroquinate synthase
VGFFLVCVRENLMRLIFEVKTSERNYPVLCGEDVLETLQKLWLPRWQQAVIIGDSNTVALFGAPIAQALNGVAKKVTTLSFPAGEEHKTRATKELLENAMLEQGIDRFAVVVAVGGGIALDVAGYVAATYMRGVDSVYIATSLLAQVDAAIGGKTGVNTQHGKNLIGAFHQPHFVLIDIPALKSLPEDEMRNGYAEAVKHAVIADIELFSGIEAFAARREKILPEPLLARCVQIKAEVVSTDERERGYRQILNFGHTIAHALEKASGFSLAHGSAVAMGMVVEAKIAGKLCGFRDAERKRLTALLAELRLPTKPSHGFSQVKDYLKVDKKTRGGDVYCALPTRIGWMSEADGTWAMPVPVSVIQDAFEKPE